MVDPKIFLAHLKEAGVSFFAGVPDSLLKEFCSCLSDKMYETEHVIAANEGAAIGLAIGHYLGTKQVPLVYLQNSGLGNIINPLLSLASPEVYGIPMLIMIGWRGEPSVKDEPQHVHQGRVMEAMLHAMEIPTEVLDIDQQGAKQQISELLEKSVSDNTPVVLLVPKGSFGTYPTKINDNSMNLSREEAIVATASYIENDAIIICTTGMASRELFEYRVRNKMSHAQDFLTVGGMGHANQIALGLAIAQPNRTIYCFDGDGAALMHMGSLAIIGQSNCANLRHIILNNGVHGSVGGQSTVGFQVDIPAIAQSCGYGYCASVEDVEGLKKSIDNARNTNCLSLIEIKTNISNRTNIGRPTSTPRENKEAMMGELLAGVK